MQLAAQKPAAPSAAKPHPEGLGLGDPNIEPTGPMAPDPVVQLDFAPGDAPQELTAPLLTIGGQTSPFTPPDPVGDVGPNHYVQMVNTSIQIYNKQGFVLVPSFAINQLWINGTQPGTGFDQCRTQNAGDPIVLYDQQADRWMVSQFTDPNTATGPGGTFPMCIAYSQTGNPTGSWFLYQFNLPASHDYMKYGIWPDGLYMSTFEGSSLGNYVFDRAAMLSGSPATFQYFSIPAGNGVDGRRNRILPSDWDGANPPPPGAPNFFTMSLDDGFDGGNDRLEIREFHVDWTTPANSTFNLVTTLDTASFDSSLGCNPGIRDCIPQPGTAQKVDALSNRLMHRLQYRNFGAHQAMVVSQTVDATVDDTNRAGIRWYELRNTGAGWSIFQQGTFAPNDGVHRWMPSAAMDGKGNIAIGYTVSNGTNTFPGLRYTGRHSTDALGSLPQGERVLVTGAVAATTTNRWGDYASMNVDPVDDCTFWFTGEHDNGLTTIGSFRFPSCSETDLQILKFDSPDPVRAGENLTYNITVQNLGSNTANGVIVTDVLPAGVTFLSSAPPCNPLGNTLACPMGNILPGQTVNLTVQVEIPSDFLGSASSATILNTASVAATNQTDPNLGNNTATATTTVQALADLAVTKVCKPDDPAGAGGTAFCDIFVDNLGPSDATGVSLTDVLTSATPFLFVSAVPSAGSCITSGSGGTFITQCNLGTVPSGGRVTVRVTVSAADTAQINDVATVSSATPDPNTANNQATGKVEFTGLADLSIDKTGPASVVAGTHLTYVITVANDGPSTALGVSVSDTLPEGVSFVSVTTSAGSCSNGQPGARDVHCGLGNLAAGASAQITIVGFVAPDVAPGTILFNECVVSSATADPDNGNNQDSVQTVVAGSADLSVTKDDSSDPVQAGNALTYTVIVHNAGPSMAGGVLITDTLPAGTSFVSGEDGNGATVCTLLQNGDVVCDLGSIAPGASKTVFITALVSPSVPDGTLLTNTAVVSSVTADPDPIDNTATETTLVETSADLWIDQIGEKRTGNPSPVLVYTLVVHNDAGCESDAQSSPTPTCGAGGPSDAQNIVVTDTLPLDAKKLVVQFVSPQCTYDKPTHTVRCTADTIPAGASAQFVIEVQVKGSVGLITNTASCTSGTTDPVSGNNTDSVDVVMKGGTGKN
ncbi:DUF11 domain-containing protein [Polyangium sp. 6x1]|uniref:COG1361 S-layer family protein n=1 Tax=Polyangium sp. 6x1 TaxID=3042689 RepID=UPI002482F32F|nr:DUF11 domain-containing protein [Polyangium sp. 6x1]